jgi:hypothetical protein
MSWKQPSPNLTILCPGASLARWTRADLPRAGPVVCINRAILRGVDLAPARVVWAWLDTLYFSHQVQERPELGKFPTLTLQERAEEARQVYRIPVSTIWHHAPSSDTPGLFTIAYALRYAISTPAPEIHVYGMDQNPGADWDGQEPPGANRSPERWERERLHLRPLMSPRVVIHR